MGHIFVDFIPEEGPKRPVQRLTGAFYTVCFFGLPLVLWRGFFAVTEAKAVFFALAALLYLLGVGVLRMQKKAARPPVAGGWTAADGAMAVFSFAFLLSSCLNPGAAGSIVAADNRYQGIVTVMLYAAVFLTASRGNGFSRNALLALTLAYAVAALLGILNFASIDPLHTLAPLTAFDRGRYCSTLGNINFFGSYIILFLPAFWRFACESQKCGERILLFCLGMLGTMAAMASKSESTVLGLGAAILLMPLLPQDKGALRRLPWVLLAAGASAQGMNLLKGVTGIGYFSSLTTLLLRPAVFLCGAALLILAGLLLRRAKESSLRTVRRGYAIALAGFLILLLIAAVLINTVFSHAVLPEPLGLLRFDESWGTDRGTIWRFCINTFKADAPLHRLIGGGPGCIARADAKKPLFSDAIVDSAHNEYLQYLMTAGILGLASYLALLGLTAWESLRYDRSPLSAALLLGAVAYAAGAFVNIAQPASTPLFFLVLTVLHGRAIAAREEGRAIETAEKIGPAPS